MTESWIANHEKRNKYTKPLIIEGKLLNIPYTIVRTIWKDILIFQFILSSTMDWISLHLNISGNCFHQFFPCACQYAIKTQLCLTDVCNFTYQQTLRKIPISQMPDIKCFLIYNKHRYRMEVWDNIIQNNIISTGSYRQML